MMPIALPPGRAALSRMYAGFGTPTASPAPLTATAAAMPTSFPVATNPPIPRGMPNNILVLMGAATMMSLGIFIMHKMVNFKF